MEYYVGATLLSITMAWTIKKIFGFEKHKVLKMFIALLPLTIVSAIRYNVGWDYQNYVDAYSGYIDYGKLYFDEIGFKGIVRFLASMTDDPAALFATFSCLTSLFFALCFKHYGSEKHVVQYILLFFMTRFFFCSLNIIRQALAMVIIFYAFHFILNDNSKKSILKFAVFILLAASLHKLALIFIPLGLILKLDLRKILTNTKVLLLIGVGLIALVIFLVSSGYFAYFDSMFGNDGTIAISELLICLTILVFGWINYRRITENVQNKLFYNFELVGLIVCFLSPFIPTADRIIWYFVTLPSIYLIPEVIDSYGKKMAFIPMAVLYVFLGVVVYNQAIATDSYDIIPYQNIVEVREMRASA